MSCSSRPTVEDREVWTLVSEASEPHRRRVPDRPATLGAGVTGKVIRKAERRIIAEAVNYAAEGRGLVVSISGETGVGKTHLATEGLRLAGRRGFRILRGVSTRYHEDVSFAPLVQALCPLVDPAEKSGAAITSGLTDLAQLFSWLKVPYPAPIRDRGAERSRLFEAVRALIQRAAVERPVAILVDDLHWADSCIAGPARISGVEPW